AHALDAPVVGDEGVIDRRIGAQRRDVLFQLRRAAHLAQPEGFVDDTRGKAFDGARFDPPGEILDEGRRDVGSLDDEMGGLGYPWVTDVPGWACRSASNSERSTRTKSILVVSRSTRATRTVTRSASRKAVPVRSPVRLWRAASKWK